MGSFFGSKPSEAHVIWRSGRDNDGKKRFDFEYLELWAAHFGADYEEWERVDHDRGDEPRGQHVCVFARTSGSEAELSMGGESWSLGGTERPRTFVEIDDEVNTIRYVGPDSVTEYTGGEYTSVMNYNHWTPVTFSNGEPFDDYDRMAEQSFGSFHQDRSALEEMWENGAADPDALCS